MKHTLLVPIAGDGKRFVDAYYSLPKPLIPINVRGKDTTILEFSMSCIDDSSYDQLIFIVQQKHIEKNKIDEFLKSKWNCEVLVTKEKTRGTLETCLLAKDSLIEQDKPLAIYCPDVWFSPIHKLKQQNYLLTFQSTNPAYSYVKLNEYGLVCETQEKNVISNHAAVGLYCFRYASSFFETAKEMIDLNQTMNGEFYLCPIYNKYIEWGIKVSIEEKEKMYVLGTPEELSFLEGSSFYNIDNPIVLMADHSGFLLKEKFKEFLFKNNYKFFDVGCYDDSMCDYSDFIENFCDKISTEDGLGFAFCRTGQGVNMAIHNKKNPSHQAALIWDEYIAEFSVRHNSARIFSIPTKYVDITLLIRMFSIIKNTTFDGGRHQTRLMKANGYI